MEDEDKSREKLAEELARMRRRLASLEDPQERAEEALMQSEERLRFALDAALMGSWELDFATGTANRSLRHDQIFGYEELLPEWSYDLFLEHVHPEDRSFVQQRFDDAARTGGNWEFECRIFRADGALRWIWARGAPYRDEHGQPARFLGGVIDITERKRSEEALRRQAELLDLSHEPIFAWELGGGIVYWNRGSEKLYGYSREEAVGKVSHRLLGTVHPVPPEQVESELEREGRWVGELVHTTRDGRRVVVESRHALVETSDGQRLVLETNRDVTERKEAEEALEGSEDRLRLLVRNSSDVISVFDADGTVVYQSPSMMRVLGHKPEDRIGKNVFVYPLVHPDDLRFLRAFFAEARANPGADAMGEFRLSHADGSWRHIEAVGRNLLDEPSVAGIVANYRDVTGRRRAEEALRGSREAERRRISWDLHDVVLQDLSGALQALQLARLRAQRSGLDLDLSEEIEALRRAAGGLRGAVHDLRLQGDRPFVCAVEDLVESERRLDPKREFELSVSEGFPEELPEALGSGLLRVVREALINARRHSGARRVEVDLGMDRGRVRVEVADDGRGFEPGETSETVGGSVGLSSMRERVEALGGSFEVRSRPGESTRVAVLVPLS